MRRLLSALSWLVLALAVDIGAASAQPAGRVYRVGWLWLGVPGAALPPLEQSTTWAPLREVLRDHGYVLGKNLVVDRRHAHGDVARLGAEAEALVTSGADVIITLGTLTTVAAMRATKRIPIVMAFVGDPVEKGLVASLNKPGGNVTGMATLIAYPKLWQFLKEASPSLRRVAVVGHERSSPVLGDRQAAYREFHRNRWTDAAASIGVEWGPMGGITLADADSRFAEFAGGGNAGILIETDSTLSELRWRTTLMDLAIKHRLPSACPQTRVYAEAGCLVTYTEDGLALVRGVGTQVVKILRGAKPADIPVELPSSGYKLIINAVTAKKLELTVPRALLVQADEVIE